MLLKSDVNRPQRPKSIAVIGAGISGLSAAWLLSRNHHVSVFEAGSHAGGHSNTVDVRVKGKQFPVDTGFIVFNPPNYPNLTALFEYLSVPTTATDMSFSVSRDSGGFEYSGGDNFGLFAQRSNIFRRRMWQMIAGLLKFYGRSETYLNEAGLKEMTLGDLLARDGYSRAFIEDHLAPMGAAIWSSDSDEILNYPAHSFLHFFKNHGLVQLKNRPQWRTVTGGSREYVKRLMADMVGNVNLNSPVAKVHRFESYVEIQFDQQEPQFFEEVVFACHSDQALSMIVSPTADESTVLGDLRYSSNRAVLHTDTRFMPKRRNAWASWNYIEGGKGDRGPAITYWMNRLQRLPTDVPVMVTLNPHAVIAPEHILGEYEYDHPIFDQAANRAKASLMDIQGLNRSWFCGAYLGDGFHEDGIQSGLAVAELLGGVRRPWQKPNQNARIGLPDDVLGQAG